MGLILALGWFGQWYFQNPLIFPICVVIAVGMSFGSYYGGDQVALTASRAKQIEKKDNTYVWNLVQNLAITAGLPMPKVYIIQDAAENAFATGRDPKHASIALTSGIIDKLENEELEGVIAHELSHVGNYDTRLMAIVVVLVGLVTLMTDFMLRMAFWGSGENRDSGQLGLVIMAVGFVLLLLSPLFAMLIQLAVSRKREYAADASGALLTRYPEGLASALEKIDKDQTPFKEANKATAHLYIANPFKNRKKDGQGWFSKLFNTHPPIADRVKILREMEK
ncbi:zinc metalloprotease HtpX [Patescibacteria group bacterium]|nr:zinc metalloprotease HtpX [Patescibacteria group bacterium]